MTKQQTTVIKQATETIQAKIEELKQIAEVLDNSEEDSDTDASVLVTEATDYFDSGISSLGEISLDEENEGE